jgi:hypothetical protein
MAVAAVNPIDRVPYFDFVDNSDHQSQWLASFRENSGDDDECSSDTDLTNRIANLNEENKKWYVFRIDPLCVFHVVSIFSPSQQRVGLWYKMTVRELGVCSRNLSPLSIPKRTNETKVRDIKLTIDTFSLML